MFHAQVAKYHESALIEAQILRDVNFRERSTRRSTIDTSLCVEMFAQFEHQVRPVDWTRISNVREFAQQKSSCTNAQGVNGKWYGKMELGLVRWCRAAAAVVLREYTRGEWSMVNEIKGLVLQQIA